jgi:peptide/nickel transport system permease protein
MGRIARSLVVVWVVVSASFAINELLPGDPARLVAGVQARPADVARIRVQLGLDRPPGVRYALFWRRLVHLGPRAVGAAGAPEHASCAVVLPLGDRGLHVDFGKSFQMNQPVIAAVAERLPRTLVLALAGVFVQLLFGVATGALAARRKGTWTDAVLVGVSVFGISVPTFLSALALQYVFARELRWLPLDGFGTTFAEHAASLVLPAVTLGVYGAAYYTRLVRDEMLVIMRGDWVRTARAKGLGEWAVTTRHGLRNALLPLVTALALDFGALMGGAVVTETVFRWPGLGELSVRATADHDGPVLMACVIVSSVAVVAANLLADLSYALVDPRVTAPRERGSRSR